MLDKIKALMDLQTKMGEVKKELENAIFEITSQDTLVKITMSASQEVKQIDIQGDIQAIGKMTLENAIKDAYNRAIKHSHDIAAKKMKDISGINLPGLS